MFWNEWPTLKECVEQKLLLEVDLYFARCVLYRNNLKNREFDKEAPQNSCSERATIAERQGASENKNSEAKPTRSKPDSSSCFGTQSLGSRSESHAALPAYLFARFRQGHLVWDTEEEVPLLLEPLLREAMATFPAEGIEEGNQITSRPIYKRGSCYYLQKNWMTETTVLTHLERLNAAAPSIPLNSSVDCLGNALQTQAIHNALASSLSILTGGPGTGKTFTAAQIIKTALSQLSVEERQRFRILLAAPTGKAVAQLESALKKALEETSGVPLIEAKTLHALLKITPYVREEEEPLLLFADLILVDECSMIDATLFAKLLAAVPSGCRLVLIGDKQQLPPVEIGSVFADLVDSGRFHTTILTHSLRSDRREILLLAEKIQAREVEAVFDLFSRATDACWKALPTRPHQLHAFLWEQFQKHFCSFYSQLPDPKELLTQLNRFCILSCKRQSAFGVEEINSAFLREYTRLFSTGNFWAIPIMITRNDYELELFNGDQGILVRSNAEDSAYFPDRRNPLSYRTIAALVLPAYEPCYALSVHKSQGSEYDEVLIVAPEGSEEFGREVLYTAVTRARHKVTLLSAKEVIEGAIERSARKRSGIPKRLQNLAVGQRESSRSSSVARGLCIF